MIWASTLIKKEFIYFHFFSSEQNSFQYFLRFFFDFVKPDFLRLDFLNSVFWRSWFWSKHILTTYSRKKTVSQQRYLLWYSNSQGMVKRSPGGASLECHLGHLGRLYEKFLGRLRCVFGASEASLGRHLGCLEASLCVYEDLGRLRASFLSGRLWTIHYK